MIKSILSWLVLSLPTAVEAKLDYLDFKEGKKDKKKIDVVVRGCLMLVASVADWLILGSQSIWQSFILSAVIFVMFFDYIMGYLLTKNPFFLGTTSQTDSLWKRIGPIGGIIWRGVIFVLGIKLYYNLESVLG